MAFARQLPLGSGATATAEALRGARADVLERCAQLEPTAPHCKNLRAAMGSLLEEESRDAGNALEVQQAARAAAAEQYAILQQLDPLRQAFWQAKRGSQSQPGGSSAASGAGADGQGGSEPEPAAEAD